MTTHPVMKVIYKGGWERRVNFLRSVCRLRTIEFSEVVGCFFCSIPVYFSLSVPFSLSGLWRGKLITEIRDLRRTMENQIMGMQDELKKSKE